MKEASPKRILRKGAQAIALLLFGFTAACSGGLTPDIETKISECGGAAGLDIQPGSLYKVSGGIGGSADISLNPDGTELTINKTTIYRILSGITYGTSNTDNPLDPHFKVEVEGFTDTDGALNLNVEYVCPRALITPNP